MNTVELAAEKRIPLRQIADFRSPVNPIDPSLKARHALRREVKNIHRDVDHSQIKRLRQVIAATDGIDEGAIVFGHGASHLIRLFLDSMKVRKVALIAPHWPQMQNICVSRNIAAVSLEWGDARTGEACMSCSGTVDAVIIPYPHCVTGRALSSDDVGVVIDAARKLGKYVVIDESLRDYTELPSVTGCVTGSSNAIIIRTMSTFHALKALRFGYAVAGKEVIAAMSGACDETAVSGIVYPVVRASMRDAGFHRRTGRFITEEKQFIVDKLKTVTNLVVDNPGGNLLLVRGFDEGVMTAEMFLRWNILVDCYTDERGKPFFPVMIQKHDHNARLVRAIKSFLG